MADRKVIWSRGAKEDLHEILDFFITVTALKPTVKSLMQHSVNQ